jgi:hypothetical protein
MKLNPTNKCLQCGADTSGNLYCDNNCGSLYRAYHPAPRGLLPSGICNNPECGAKCEGSFCNERCRRRRDTIRQRKVYMKEQPATIITARMIQEPKQEQMFTPPPVSGPPCRVCGKPLHHYDVDRGECFRHPVARLRNARESVPLMMTDKPQRTRVQRRYHQRQAAPVAGD